MSGNLHLVTILAKNADLAAEIVDDAINEFEGDKGDYSVVCCVLGKDESIADISHGPYGAAWLRELPEPRWQALEKMVTEWIAVPDGYDLDAALSVARKMVDGMPLERMPSAWIIRSAWHYLRWMEHAMRYIEGRQFHLGDDEFYEWHFAENGVTHVQNGLNPENKPLFCVCVYTHT